MRADHDLERRIADHYEAEAPSRAPDWVLGRVLDAVDTTPQRRTVLGRPWRIPAMPSTLAKLGVTAAVVVAIGAAGLVFLRPASDGPAAPASPSISPRPSPATGYARFDSTRHGVSIDYPSGWQIRPATEPWTTGKPGFDSADADVLFDPALGEDVYLAIASRPLGGETDPTDLLSMGSDGCGGGGGSFHVDGARAFDWHCGGGSATVGIVTGTRGYVIKLVVSEGTGLGQTYNGEWLDELLNTVRLRPEDAVDR